MTKLPRGRLLSCPLLILAAGLSLGILLGADRDVAAGSVLTGLIIVSVFLALLSLCLAIKQRTTTASILLLIAIAIGGFLLSAVDHRHVKSERLSRVLIDQRISADDPIELTGTIAGEAEPAPEGFYLTLQVESIQFANLNRNVSGNVSLFASAEGESLKEEYAALALHHGARIRVMTTLDREDAFRNPGVMPFTEYLERKGFEATGVIKSPLLIERLDDAPVFLPVAWLYEWRAKLEHEFHARFSADTAGVLDAALLGNRYNISRSTADRFRAGGTFHVLVIAGLHISFIGGLALLLARRLSRRRLVQFLLSATFLWAYTIAVGAQIPVERAALMFTLVVFGPVVWRRANSLNVVGGALLVLLVIHPDDLFDPAFQLTFTSIASIVLIATPLLSRMQQIGSWRPTTVSPYPPEAPNWLCVLSEGLFWSETAWRSDMERSVIRYRIFKSKAALLLERWRLQRVLRFAATAIVLSTAVQLGMLPLLIIYFHRLSFASIVLNILIGSLMVLLAVTALSAVLLALISSPFAAFLVGLAEKLDWLMVHLVDPFINLGVASIRLPHYSGAFSLVYGVYFAVLGLLIAHLMRWNPLQPKSITSGKPGGPNLRLKLGVLAFVGVLGVIVFHPFSASRPDGKLHFDFIDVGQGDSALATLPDGTTFLIDGGGKVNVNRFSPDASDGDEPFQRDTRSIGEGVVSEYLWSRGLDRIDYLLATHADADHIDGLNDVAGNFKVREAIVARSPKDDPEFQHFAQTMKTMGIPVQKIGAGDLLRIGNVIIEVLWPPPNDDINAASANNDSLMLRWRYGNQAFLLTGDIEKEGEAAVLSAGSDLRSDVVKVAHHGSKTSSTKPFVSASEAQLAIISVGRRSIFGHPNKEVVDRWRESGAQVMTTGENGTISVTSDGRSMKVSTFVHH